MSKRPLCSVVHSCLALLFGTCGLATRAEADLVTLRFEGTAESSSLGDVFPVGSTVTWTLGYDSATPGDSSSPNLFNDIFTLHLDVGGYVYDGEERATLMWNAGSATTNPTIGFDQSLWAYDGGRGDLVAGQYRFYWFDFSARWTSGDTYTPGVLPTTLPSGPVTGGFVFGLCRIGPFGFCDGYAGEITGTATSVTATSVPEPTTFLLVSLGLAGAAIRNWRRD